MFAHCNGTGFALGHAGRERLVLGLVVMLFPAFAVTHQRFELLSEFLGETDTRPAVLHFKCTHTVPGKHEILHINIPLFFERIKRGVKSINLVFVDDLLRRFFVNVEQRDILRLAGIENHRIQVLAAIVGAAELHAALDQRPENHFAVRATAMELGTVNRLYRDQIEKQIHATSLRFFQILLRGTRESASACKSRRATWQKRSCE